MKPSEQRLNETRRQRTEAIVARHMDELFRRLPMLSGFWLGPYLEMAELSVSWPGCTAGTELYEEVMQSLVDLAEERPEAVRVRIERSERRERLLRRLANDERARRIDQERPKILERLLRIRRHAVEERFEVGLLDHMLRSDLPGGQAACADPATDGLGIAAGAARSFGNRQQCCCILLHASRTSRQRAGSAAGGRLDEQPRRLGMRDAGGQRAGGYSPHRGQLLGERLLQVGDQPPRCGIGGVDA